MKLLEKTLKSYSSRPVMPPKVIISCYPVKNKNLPPILSKITYFKGNHIMDKDVFKKFNAKIPSPGISRDNLEEPDTSAGAKYPSLRIPDSRCSPHIFNGTSKSNFRDK